MKKENKKEIFLVLHNIRSLFNVGSIFRTADGAGVSKIFLTGYTPAPVDMFGKVRKEIAKTALGAEKTVAWEKHKDVCRLIRQLQDFVSPAGLTKSIVAIEQSSDSINYKKFKPRYPLVLVLGSEVRGLSKAILQKCDAIIEIPMAGKKESLNVSVAAGVVLFNIV